MRFVIFAGPLIYLAMIGTYLAYVTFPHRYMIQTSIYVLLVVMSILALEGVGRFLMRPLIMNMKMVLKTGEALVQTSDDGLSRSRELANSNREQMEAVSQIEKTIRKLEDLSDLYRKNATATKDHVTETVRISREGIEEVSRLTESVFRIEQGSNEITSITKTIDEISFQTQLLSLNASVEAARAKGAGRGFSIVAEEVRSLSHRATEAAKMTTDILKRNRIEVENSRKVTEEFAQLFESLNQSINNTNLLADNVSTASREQYEYVAKSVKFLNSLSEGIRYNADKSQLSEKDSRDLSKKSIALQNVARGFSRLIKGKE